GVDPTMDHGVREEPRYDNQATQADADARQVARVREQSDPADVGVEFALQQASDRFGPCGGAQLPPQIAPRGPEPAEQRETHVRGECPDDGLSRRRFGPCHESCAVETPGVIEPAARIAYQLFHMRNRLNLQEN